MSDDKGPGPSQDLKTRPPRSKAATSSPFTRIWIILLVLAIVAVVVLSIVPATQWVFSDGYLITDREAELHAPVEAMIQTIEVQTGDLVSEGQTLIKLDALTLRAELKEAQAVAESKAKSMEELDMNHAMRREKHAEDLEQAQELYAKSQVKMKQIEERPDAFSEGQKVGTRQGLEQLDKLKRRIEHERAAMEIREQALVRETRAADERVSTLKQKIEARQIRSPLNGRVHFNDFNVGELVKPEHVLGQVFDESTWIVKLKISERDYGRVEIGQSVTVGVTAYPPSQYGYAQGQVTRIVDVVTPQATGDGIYYAEATITDFGEIEPAVGQSARVWIDTGQTSYLWYLLGR